MAADALGRGCCRKAVAIYTGAPTGGARLGEGKAPARRERKGGVPENLEL
jgi:hypothetical protein